MPAPTLPLRATLLLALLVPLAMPPAAAQALQPAQARLPQAEWSTSAVWDGTHAYVFGGESCLATLDCTPTDQIVRYDPATDHASVMDARLPTPRAGTSAVWDGRAAYVFGGSDASGALDQIVRFDPANGTVDVLPAKLPDLLTRTSAIWDGKAAYLFGGAGTHGPDSDRIVRFDPANGTVEPMRARLTEGRHATAAVWDGRVAHVFGGRSSIGHRAIGAFSPEADEYLENPTALPEATHATAAFWDGRAAYLLGGGSPATPSPAIVRYHPPSRTVEPMRAELSDGVSGASAVWTGTHAIVFGGEGGAIHRYDPTQDQPPLPTPDLHLRDGATTPHGQRDETPAPATPHLMLALGLAALLLACQRRR